MEILVLNQDWFVKELRAAGHKVISMGLANHLDVKISHPLLHIDSLIAMVEDFKPDAIIVHDNSAPIYVSGLEETKIPILFYSVDIHHHLELHQHLAQIFDYILVAQRDYITQLGTIEPCPEWMPLWASRMVAPAKNSELGAVFVGTLDKKLNPERVHFFEQLRQKTEMTCTSGEWWDLFSKSKIVVNQTVKGDLNFRVFEAMISGAMLLTERSENGLLELFTEGKELVTYKKNDVDEAADKITYFLKHPEEAAAIAQAGRQRILSAHLPIHRAERVENILKTLKKKPKSPVKFLAAMANYSMLGVRLQKMDIAYSNRAFLSAMKATELAFQHGEIVSEEYGALIVLSALRYDLGLQSNAGSALLNKLAEAYPSIIAFTLARIRLHLNCGEMAQAQSLAGQIYSGEPDRLFQEAEEFIGQLLSAQSS